jgi:GTP-binding protein
MKPIPSQRVVAIVGRPNVGKSALFNRLARRRIAIVHEESGVTRDRVSHEVTWGDHRFELIDTGGIALQDGAAALNSIEQGTRDQVDIAIGDAAVIIFVTDLTSGIVPMDEEVARLLHASGRPVFIAANKADRPDQDAHAVDYEALGFKAFPVSALHKRGAEALIEAVIEALPPAEPAARLPALKVAVVGRPNVGKSSYINHLLGNERLIVSDVAGTTRDSIEVPFSIGHGDAVRNYVMIDTAGMRKVGKVHQSVERFSVFRAEKSIERADIVCLMIEAVQGPTVQDKKIASKILESRKGCVILVNKWDMAKGADAEEYEKALRRELFFLDYAPIVFASSTSGYNIRRSIEAIDHVAAQVSTMLPTGLLNRTLHDAFKRVQPPEVKGHRLKFYYCAQTGVQPLWFRMFVNDPRRITDAYRIYLQKAMRRAFGLEGAPLVLDFRSSHSLRPETHRRGTRRTPSR